MNIFILFVVFFFVNSCVKPKTVTICGDHVCINKAEAKQYFEDNLSIEVKIIDKEKNKISNLIELNLKKDSTNKREVSVIKKNKTNQKVKVLSNDEIDKIKKEIKIKKKEKKLVKKIENIRIDNKNISLKKESKIIEENKNKVAKKDNKNNKKIIVDVCTIIDKCSIEEISNYLIKEAKKKSFPDITTRDQ